MSQFGDNPYLTPQASSPNHGQSQTPSTLPVGIALVVVGALSLLIVGGYFILTVIAFALDVDGELRPTPDMAPEERIGFYVGAYGVVIFLGLLPLLQIPVILGGINMIRGKGLRMAMFACVLSVIPVCSSCCVVGMPFGIWGLILLSNPQVKAAMRS